MTKDRNYFRQCTDDELIELGKNGDHELARVLAERFQLYIEEVEGLGSGSLRAHFHDVEYK